MPRPTVVAHWPFSRGGVDVAARLLRDAQQEQQQQQEAAATDSSCTGSSSQPSDASGGTGPGGSGESLVTRAVVEGIGALEVDPQTGPYFVGVGGMPNTTGVVECDAAVMCGATCGLGAVAALPEVMRPALVAYDVLRRRGTRHAMLVGGGALAYAKERGHATGALLLDAGREAHARFLQDREAERARAEQLAGGMHDTVGVIAVDHAGRCAAAVSTSGMAFKHPGRVGDSALPGNGIYADDHGGAAVVSGDGDIIMRFCPAFQVVQLMEGGTAPTAACETVVDKIQARLQGSGQPRCEIFVLALNVEGEVGSAGTADHHWSDHVTHTEYDGFPFCVWQQGNDESEVRICKGRHTSAGDGIDGGAGQSPSLSISSSVFPSASGTS